jgi:Fe-S-cluster-containing hydrogenase component 2
MDALVKSEGKVKLLPERCIGCGLCVTKCPKNALKLTKKSKNKKPPMNTEVLYMSILSSKVSKGKMILNLIKLGTGMRL